MQNNKSGAKVENIVSKLFKYLLKNKVYIGILIGIVSFLIAYASFDAPFVKNAELASLEVRFKNLHGQKRGSDRCIVIGVDVKSVAEIGRWPWDRSLYAELLDALNFYKISSVSFDLFFVLPNEKDRKGDKIFADAVAKYGNVIIGNTVGEEGFQKPYSKEELERLSKLSIENVGPLDAISLKEMFKKNKDLKEKALPFIYKPYKELFNVIDNMGLVVGSIGKSQGRVYSYPLAFDFRGSYYPNLALATYLKHVGTREVTQEKGFLMVSDIEIPVSGYDQYVINWYAPKKEGSYFPYDKLSFVDVLNAYRTLKTVSEKTGISVEQVQENIDLIYQYDEDEDLPADLEAFTEHFPDDAIIFSSDTFRDKFAFIGITDASAGTQDMVSTLLIDLMPGVFLHANVMDNFLHKDFIKVVPRNTILMLMLLLCVLTGSTVLGLKDLRFAIGIGLLFCFYFLVPLALFYFDNIYLDLTRIQGAIVFTFLCSVIFQWVFVDKDKQLFKNTFSNYLSPQVMNEILTDPSKVELGGDNKEITILFSDIRGFTSISEQSTPEEVVLFLNEYFDAMVDEIIKTDGTVDKFIGDAIMAFWGAPVEKENHPELAIRGALGMCKALEDIKKKWTEEGKDYPEINIGIGLNSGEAIVGNVGSSKIKSYTVIGDSVNLASRLEGLNKKYAKHGDTTKNVIISEYTYEKVKDIVNVEYLGQEKVKGKDISVGIYKVLDIKGGNNEE